MCFNTGDSGAGAQVAQSKQQQAQLQNAQQNINAVFQGGQGTLYTPVDSSSFAYNPSQTYYVQSGNGMWKPIGGTAAQQASRAGQNRLFTASQYNEPGYNAANLYNKTAQDYVNYYMPQVAQQANQASRSLTYSLANQGILDSSASKQAGSNLNRAINTQQQAVVAGGQQAANSLEKQMSGAQAQLIAQAQASVDPASAAQNALQTAGQYSVPSQWAPLMNGIFNGAVPAIAATAAGGQLYTMPSVPNPSSSNN